MTVLSNVNPSLIDIAKAHSSDMIVGVAEVLSKKNPSIGDMTMVQGTHETSNQVKVRTSLPTTSLTALYEGVAASRGGHTILSDTVAMFESRSEVDERELEIQGNPDRYRALEAQPHLESMAQRVATSIFYGSPKTNQREFMGLAARYSTPSADDTNQGFNMIDGGGAGADNTSIWLVCWGERKVTGFYPKNNPDVGLRMRKAASTERVDDASGNPYDVYTDKFMWKMGLSVYDWRYVVRICNIDVSDLSADMSTGANLHDLLAKAIHIPPDLNGAVLYGSRYLMSMYSQQRNYITNVRFPKNDAPARIIEDFAGIPFKREDAILETEAKITGTFANH